MLRARSRYSVDPPQAIKEGGSHRKENHQHRHRHFGAHAKAQPQHQQRGEGKDRDRLTGEHQRHQPALQTRIMPSAGDAERHAQRRRISLSVISVCQPR